MTTEKSPEAENETPQRQPRKAGEEERREEASQPAAGGDDGSGQQQVAAEPSQGPATPEPLSRRRTAEGRGLSRLFSSLLRRPRGQGPVDSEAADDEATGDGAAAGSAQENGEGGGQGDAGVATGLDGEILLKAPIADPEPELKTDPSLDLHSLSSLETQLAQEELREEPGSEARGGDEPEESSRTEGAQRDGSDGQTDGDSRPPPRAGRRHRNMNCRVSLLDGTTYECVLEKHAKGQDLIRKVCDHLNLLEEDYFGLAVWDSPTSKTWLDSAKEIRKQVHGAPWNFTFSVKFYPPDPAQLTEDITRYYLCLQLRQDIITGRLPCSFATLALLSSYTVQSELGDFDPELHGDDYVSEFQLAPNQTKELEEKVSELHKSYRSMTPAQADLEFLENAKKLSMYGVDLHQAKDLEGVDIVLGVCSSGLLVYKDKLRINRFPWPKVLKISYKRSSFFIKIRPGEHEQYESTIGFKLPSYRAAKKLWKVCVEHHTFFRLTSTEAVPKSRFLALGSKFRYSGRTQAQTRQASALIDRPAPQFERTTSKRASRSLDGATAAAEGTPGRSPRPKSAPAISQSHIAEGGVPGTSRKPEVSGADGEVAKADEKLEESQAHLAIPESSEARKVEKVPVEGEVSAAANGDPVQPPPTEKLEDTVRMRKDLDKTQEEIKKHHASISELKKNFMESVPEPRPSEWDKRLSTHSPFRVLSANGQVPTGDGPPLVKTQAVTLSDTGEALKTEIPTKDVPIVHTETKTITYEAAQTDDDGSEDRDPGVLLTAQTITSETTSGTTTTQITKTVKGGISETRIEKRIVITGDADLDHDQVLVQAIKEAKEQHPDMSVTKVVVHQETEIADD
ncbi:protein 4.1 isoform X3 [Tachyglossus aculeatus]|uniref:protein 4.1 isoform X3 n=1 Tax=Tachyglossus aculeatus TaxID=9261 RepID=UPI0018F4FBB5|nr:protein 4.1 isoform X3 [Tachyglossus aculeatus]